MKHPGASQADDPQRPAKLTLAPLLRPGERLRMALSGATRARHRQWLAIILATLGANAGYIALVGGGLPISTSSG